ncbi:Vacuolar-sorting receptor 6 [Hordeum vulgare]|nr:Vacuolar-sorting receptor 6 [Hordeum vulgare]
MWPAPPAIALARSSRRRAPSSPSPLLQAKGNTPSLPLPFLPPLSVPSGCRYCVPDLEGNLGAGYRGSDAVLENLLQLCVHRVANAQNVSWAWWDFVDDYRVQCSKRLGSNHLQSPSDGGFGCSACGLDDCLTFIAVGWLDGDNKSKCDGDSTISIKIKAVGGGRKQGFHNWLHCLKEKNSCMILVTARFADVFAPCFQVKL